MDKLKLNLHVHSTCSDGKKTPSDIAKLMEENNITFALTDHDTISGLEECRSALNNKDLLINGMEYSVKLESKELTLHMLCYNFDSNILQKSIEQDEINKKLILKDVYLKLIDKGYNIKLDDLDNINKTAFADELILKGYAKDELTAKRGIINPLIEDQGNTDIKEAIKNVHNAGGKTFWAHPYEVLDKIGKFSVNEELIEEIVKEIINYGIDGLEVYYRHYTKKQVSFLRGLCDKYNLKYSSGTDIHFKASDDYLNYNLSNEEVNDILKFIEG